MPVRPSHSGFTLPELLVGMVLFGLLGLLMTRSAIHAERVTRSHEERVRLQTAFDGALAYLATELADLGRGDVLSVASDSLRFRSTRGVGLACRVTGTDVRLLTARFSAHRAPAARPRQPAAAADPGRACRSADTGWTALPIRAVRPSTCGSEPALALETALDTIATPLEGLPLLLPVRLFEVMQVRLYASLGSTWLGARSVSAGEAIQPLAGPFVAAGSRFETRDEAGGSTLDPAAVRRFAVALRGTRGAWPAGPGVVAESAGIVVAPANLAP